MQSEFRDQVGNEVSLRDFVVYLMQFSRSLFTIFVLLIFTGVIFSLSRSDIYKSEALVLAQEDFVLEGMSKVTSQYNSLAAIAGLGGGARGDRIDEAIAILQSRRFLYKFIEDQNLLYFLIAAEGWDRETNKLLLHSKTYDVEKAQWVRSVRPPKSVVPSLEEGYQQLVKIFNVEKEKSPGFLKISFEYFSPHLAKKWVEEIVKELNAYMRQRDVKEAEQSIDYLRYQIKSTPIADIHNVLYGLIEEQVKTIMLANSRSEYFLQTIDPAVAAEYPSKPNRAVIVAAFVFIGLSVVVLMLFLKRYF